MKRDLMIAGVTLVACAALVMSAFAFVGRSDSLAAQVVPSEMHTSVELPKPDLDTTSPNWKRLSDDVGVMIRRDDNLGLRGRLYVRVKGSWLPVATDGPGDTLGSIPVR
jgi:hypothetical protein